MRRAALLSLALLLVASSIAPAATAAPAATPADSLEPDERPLAALSTAPDNSSTNETTTSPNGTTTASDDERPSTAETVRILPVQLEEEFLETRVVKSGEEYNTTGPFAFFSLSEPAERVAIEQPGASATVLEGGRTVRIQYEDDAAPVGSSSLYTLAIWFPDGSSTTVALNAEKTSVSTGSAELKKYRPFILDAQSDAEDAGFERSPDGVEAYYEEQKRKAQLLNSLFTEYAKRFFASVFSLVTNPLAVGTALALLAVLGLWLLSRHRTSIEILSNDSGKHTRLIREAWVKYKEQQRTAEEEPLSELDQIGEINQIYWDDSYSVTTVAQLAELFRKGKPFRVDGETKHTGGIETINSEQIGSSWLEVVCREHRLPAPEVALSHGKAALERMCTKYGMEHLYGETLEEVNELLEDLDKSGSADLRRYRSTARDSTSRSFGSDSPAGGDD